MADFSFRLCQLDLEIDWGNGRFDGPGQIHRDEFELLMKNPEMHFAASPGDMREKTAVAQRR